ncbi:AIPR family protein [Angustibacter sp. Root456]|uniref:AIPR family protein n=1 Tax=Angustibacter sp. Root456 TaxID=1736539 RepID=UPI0007006294|nr:AIPR family protein [Angustibacter sp. Root456]KQX65920.1 hypothetical protein ASD06_05815 [Angustibacter sp. Root456]
MDKITKSLVAEYAQSEDLAGMDEARLFERFAAYSILSPKVHDTLAVDDVSVGDDSTPGIDSVAVIISGTVVATVDDLEAILETHGYVEPDFYFIQAKTSPEFDGAKIANFGEEVRLFFAEDSVPPRLRPAKDIAERLFGLGAKLKRNPDCHLFYVTTGRWADDRTPSLRRDAARDRLAELSLFRDVTVTPVGADDVQRRYRAIQNSVSVSFEFRDKVTLPRIDGVDQSYLGYLPGSQFLRIVTDEAGDLRRGIFEDNVRDFQGESNEVNDGIRRSIIEAADRFAVLNNGITIVGRQLRTTANEFTLEDFQIVNGCQTSNILFNLADSLDKVSVPVRLVITQSDEIANTITAATNSQTKVAKEDLYALLSFQKKLEDYFATFEDSRRLYYERRSQQYSGMSGVPRYKIITRAQLVKAFASVFLDEAHRATRYYSTLYTQVGKRVFDDDHKLENYYASALALYKLESLFRAQSLDRALRPARYHVLHAVRHLALGDQVGPMNSRRQEKAAEAFSRVLWADDAAGDLYRQAGEVVLEAAGGSELTRDFTKQQSFTSDVTQIAKARRGTRAGRGWWIAPMK